MLSAIVIREATIDDRAAISRVESAAFERSDEAELTERIVADGQCVLELLSLRESEIVGHVLFSRLFVARAGEHFPTVGLAPIAIDPDHWRTGIGSLLIREAHNRLRVAGERLSIVLGDPGYYGRFGYEHARAAGFESDFQSQELQALTWGDVPETGRLIYPEAFTALPG